MKLGANSVLFGGFDLDTAFKHIAMAGYDGIELSAIDGMSEHLVLDRWRELAPQIKHLSSEFGLELLAMEQPSQDPAQMELAFQAAVEIGIPIINCGPGGKVGRRGQPAAVDRLDWAAWPRMAEHYGVTLCVKAHVGRQHLQHADHAASDASHHLTGLRHRHGPLAYLPRRRKPGRSHRRRSSRASSTSISATAKDASRARASPKIRPTGAATSTWSATFACCTSSGYTGPLDLEIIGAKDYSLVQCCGHRGRIARPHAGLSAGLRSALRQATW